MYLCNSVIYDYKNNNTLTYYYRLIVVWLYSFMYIVFTYLRNQSMEISVHYSRNYRTFSILLTIHVLRLGSYKNEKGTRLSYGWINPLCVCLGMNNTLVFICQKTLIRVWFQLENYIFSNIRMFTEAVIRTFEGFEFWTFVNRIIPIISSKLLKRS